MPTFLKGDLVWTSFTVVGVGGQGCSGGVVWDPSHTGFRSPRKHICIYIYDRDTFRVYLTSYLN